MGDAGQFRSVRSTPGHKVENEREIGFQSELRALLQKMNIN